MEDMGLTDVLTAQLEHLAGNGAILRLAGEVDISSVHSLSEQLEAAANAGCSKLVIDATYVTFMDSSGIQALVEGKRLIHQNGSGIAMVPSPQVRRLLELVSPEPFFDARVDTVEEALAFLGLGGAVGSSFIE